MVHCSYVCLWVRTPQPAGVKITLADAVFVIYYFISLPAIFILFLSLLFLAKCIFILFFSLLFLAPSIGHGCGFKPHNQRLLKITLAVGVFVICYFISLPTIYYFIFLHTIYYFISLPTIFILYLSLLFLPKCIFILFFSLLFWAPSIGHGRGS
jgi:hypothetical protein